MSSTNDGRSNWSKHRKIRLGIRLGLIVVLVIAGLIFHHRGHGYEVVRGLYIVAVAALLIWRISYRRRARSDRNSGSGPAPQ